MALDPIRKAKRDAQIKKGFDVLSNKKTPKGKRLMSYAAIYEELSERFFLSEKTIEKIIFKK